MYDLSPARVKGRVPLPRRDIHAEIAGRELEILRDLGIHWPPPKGGTHIHCPNPGHPDQDPSWRWDERKRRAYCTCPECSGSVINIVMAMRGLDFKEAVAWIRGEPLVTAKAPPPPVRRKPERIQDEAAYQRQQQKTALYLWGGSLDAEASPVETYLRGRNLAGPIPSTIRYLPARPPDHPWPCMIAGYGFGVDRPVAVHLTKLAADGRGKAPVEPNKITIGSPGGHPIVLAPPNDGLGLAILEGIESALSFHAATGLGAWAAGAAGFMPSLADKVPWYVECVTIWEETGEAGHDGTYGLADKLFARGFEVRIVGRHRHGH